LPEKEMWSAKCWPQVFKRAMITILAASCAVTAAVGPAFAEDDINTLKDKQAQYAQLQQQNNEKLAALRSDESKKAEYGATLQSQVAAIEEQINDCSNQVTDLNLQMQQAENEISKKQKQIDADYAKLKERLRALYMAGEARNLQILLSSDNLADLSDKSEALQMVTEHDTTLINRLKADKAAVQKAKESIQQSREQAESVKTSFAEKQQELATALTETNQFLKEIGQQEVNLQDKNASLDVQAAKIAASIDAWTQQQEEKKKQEAAAAAAESAATQQQAASSSQSGSDSGQYSNSGSGSASNSSSSPSTSSGSFSSLIAEAEKHLGKPYVMGASGPDTFDCSSFVCWVFTHSGVYNLPRTTAQGIYNQCTPISVSEARPGDIVFFTDTYDCGETVTHVGIYTGSNTMIHAGNPVQYTSIDTSYWRKHFYAFGRL